MLRPACSLALILLWAGTAEAGAPALRSAHAIVVDDELVKNEVVYCEAGDHEHLLRLSRDQFERLMRDARRGHFCRAPMMH